MLNNFEIQSTMKYKLIIVQATFLWACTVLMLCLAMKPQLDSFVKLLILYMLKFSWWWVPVFATIMCLVSRWIHSVEGKIFGLTCAGLLVVILHVTLADYYSDIFDIRQYDHLLVKCCYSYSFAVFSLQSFIQTHIFPGF